LPGPAALPRLLLRDATVADAKALLAIYTPFVTDTAVSFETEVPPLDTFAARIDKALAQWAWLVAVDASGACLGYAYGSAHRERAAYRYCTEVSAYIAPGQRGRGLGRQLYGALFDRLAARGFCTALAGVVQPNAASMALHRAMGFSIVGTYQRAGWKFGAWHDITWLQRPLRERPPQD
jgi:L-amino acid N-acyltransferase YncA